VFEKPFIIIESLAKKLNFLPNISNNIYFMSSNNQQIIDSLLLENNILKQQLELMNLVKHKQFNEMQKQQQFLQQENNFLKMQLDAYESVYSKK
jgi:hypothetical protein